MNIPSAKDAKKLISDTALMERMKALCLEKADIEERLNTAISNGIGRITGKGRLMPGTQMELRELGYEYAEAAHHCEEYWVIAIP